ncbi:MAG: ABC transporter permease, partial [Halanaerobiales bacterium]
MGQYIFKKLIMFPLVLVVVSIIIFMSIRLIPGDPARLMAGQEATQEDVELIQKRLGLDQNIFVQYGIFFKNAIQGDLGSSIKSDNSVIKEIMARFPNTLVLASSSYFIAILFGVSSGILAAIYQNSWIDHLVMFFAILGASTANFWLALLGMSLFSVTLGILPLMGTGSWQHLVLPTLSLAFYPTALIARMTRSSMLEVMKQDYIRTA